MRMALRRHYAASMLVILVIVLTVAIGCGSSARTDSTAATASAAELRSFSKYDFSFLIPKDFLAWEDGLLDEQADADSGLVQAAPEDSPFPLVAVSWIRTWKFGLEGGLEAGFEGVESWDGVQTVTKGQLVETTKTGHRMLYQSGHRLLYRYYTATTEIQGQVACGIVGVFYCSDTQRTFTVVTMDECTTGSSGEQSLREFETLLDDFVCHG